MDFSNEDNFPRFTENASGFRVFFENVVSGSAGAGDLTQNLFRTQEPTMKGLFKDMLGFILIDLFLIAGTIWAFSKDYKVLMYGFPIYFVINTLAIMLKIAGRNKDDGGSDGNGDDGNGGGSDSK